MSTTSAEKTKPEAKANNDVCFRLMGVENYKAILPGAVKSAAGARRVVVTGSNCVVVVRANDPDYEAKLKFLRESDENKNNGGTKIIELSVDDDQNAGGDCLLDKLMALDNLALFDILKEKGEQDKALSKGKLIIKILKEKGAID
jgi:hypothetical protein